MLYQTIKLKMILHLQSALREELRRRFWGVDQSEEIQAMLEVGFEYVCQKGQLNIPEKKKMISNQAIGDGQK